MAGLYIHIPFCASRCIYCGFYSTTHLDVRQQYVDALCREMQLRRHYLPTTEDTGAVHQPPISTIYLGGGTPSQLTPAQLRQIFCTIVTVFFHGDDTLMRTHCEVTMECNPDDITPAFVQFLQHSPVNRVSMGVQSFSNERLKFLHRRHHAEDISPVVQQLRGIGIDNISVDLMFGFPNQTLDEWKLDIQKALALRVEHISAYSLMYEEGTALYQLLINNKVKEIDDELSLTMYQTLVDELKASRYEHYEISNFAKPGKRSQHNSSYWHAIPYLGIGASAHSYDIQSRQWNVSNIKEYISSIEQGEIPFEREWLDDDTRYNDLITTALRTSEGINLSTLTPKHRTYLLQQAEKQIAQNLLEIRGDSIRLTAQGLYVSDSVMADLIYA